MEHKHRINKEVVREHIPGPLLSWKTILAGFVVAVMTHLMLVALGAGIGGAAASGALQEGGSVESAAASTAVWVGLAAFIALFVASNFASRISPFVTAKVGAAQGTIIGALFFAFMIYGAGLTVGAAGKGLSSMATSIGKGASEISSNPAVQSTVQRALGDVNLKDQPSVVAQELTMYLVRNDEEGAKNYFAYQTGLSRMDVDTKLATLQSDFREQTQLAGIKAAKAVSATGWALFGTLFFGIGSAIFGGALGSRTNLRKPLTTEATYRRFVASPTSGEVMKKIFLFAAALIAFTGCNKQNENRDSTVSVVNEETVEKPPVLESDNNPDSMAGAPLGTNGNPDTVPVATDTGTSTDTDTGTGAPKGTTGVAPSASAPTAAATMPTDAEIAAIVVAANTADIAQGKLAESKTQNKEVKALAQQMVNDHGQSNKDATALASKLKLKPQENETSKYIATSGKQSIAKLQGLSGKEFDKAYIEGEVKLHQDVLNTIDQTLLPNAKNPELKALLQKTRPVIEAHLQHAQHLQSTYK